MRRRRIFRNPHKMALSRRLLGLLHDLAGLIHAKWRSALYNSTSGVVTMAAIESDDAIRGKALMVGVCVVFEENENWDGLLMTTEATETKDMVLVQLLVNMARRLSEKSIEDVLRHEMVHAGFWSKSRTDQPAPVVVSDLTDAEEMRRRILSESEYTAYVLTFIHALEDKLDKLWRHRASSGRDYALRLMETNPEEVRVVVRDNRDIVDKESLQALVMYAEHDYYSRRFADAIKFSIEDKLATLEAKR